MGTPPNREQTTPMHLDHSSTMPIQPLSITCMTHRHHLPLRPLSHLTHFRISPKLPISPLYPMHAIPMPFHLTIQALALCLVLFHPSMIIPPLHFLSLTVLPIIRIISLHRQLPLQIWVVIQFCRTLVPVEPINTHMLSWTNAACPSQPCLAVQ